MTWIKICGMTSLEDARAAVAAGADAVGFVFWEKSPRNIDPSKAREIVTQLPEQLEKVGVFVDHSTDDVQRIADKVGLTAVQLHADHYANETSEILQLGRSRPGLKLILGCKTAEFINNGSRVVSEEFRKCLYALLFDSGTRQSPGGTGKTFDWEQALDAVRSAREILPIIVAGGLTPTNVRGAIARFQPFGVDVSTGVEREPGKKDPEKVRAFVQAVHAADERLVPQGKSV